MSSDVVLTSALRTNLLSLQSTQRNIDATQLRLATGLKVNSALDNPQNFFAGQSLSNRANDLTRLLDGIGQSISTIQQADIGVSSLTNLVEQSDAIATQAREAIAAGGTEARITGNRDLRGITDLTSLAGITNGDDLIITITDPSNTTPGSNVDFDLTGATAFTATIDIATGDSIEQLLGKINDLLGDTTTGDVPVIEAELDTEGQLVLRTLNGGDLNVDFVANAAVDADNLAFAAELGFGGIATLNGDNTNGNNNVEITASASRQLSSFALFEAVGGTDLAERSDALNGLVNSQGTALFAGLDNNGDTVGISINGGTTVSISLNAQTIQGFIDGINSDDSLNGLISADFNDETGQITIEPIDASVETIKFDYDAQTATDDFNFGFGVTAINNVEANTGVEETIRFGSAAAQLADLEEEFDNVRSQLSTLAGDSGYRGTNLLNGDDLTTFFDETRTNTLVTEGQVFDADGLGISQANFGSISAIDGALAEVRGALDSLRSFGNSIANDLSIIQTRQDFTEQTVNNLEAGRDKLVVADQNEEGANLLALQTRQQLGVTSLSLASQSQQAVLRLF